jgi:cyanophycin synthetase
VLREHLDRGGAAAFLEDGWLAWCEAGLTQRVVQAAQLPFTLRGHARYNIANALAALAALRCMGLEPALIARALSSFVSDARSNPLRSHQFEVGGVRLLLDYAHNVVAYRALCETARSLLEGRGRLLGVVTSPGDRRAGDLFETGRVCGEGFDELVVYEQDPRGRGLGETAQAILAGARSVTASKPLHAQPQIRLALRDGLALARPGDILVFTCAGTFDDFVEGVRLVDPAAARRIASEIQA